LKASMLPIEIAIPYASPQSTATGRTAKRYSTARLSTGTCGFSSSIAPVTAATSATLTSTPVNRRRRSAASRQRRSWTEAAGDAGVAEAGATCRSVATDQMIATPCGVDEGAPPRLLRLSTTSAGLVELGDDEAVADIELGQ